MNDYIRTDEMKDNFKQKFTAEDLKEEFEKEYDIIKIKNKVM